MDWPLAITAFGFLLIAIGISSRDTGVWPMLAGMVSVVLGVLLRLVAGDGLFDVIVNVLWNAGLGLLIAAIWLGVRSLGSRAYPFLMLGLGCLAVAGLLFGASRLWPAIWSQSERSLIVELGPDDLIGEVANILEEHEATWEEAFPSVALSADENLAQMYLIHAPASQVDALMAALRADLENVDHVELNVEVDLSPLPTSDMNPPRSQTLLVDDPYASRQWALEAIFGHEAHALLKDRTPERKARVAILDTGVEAAHEDLVDTFSSGRMTDRHGHGTHCAGLAGAATNNSLGVASLNWEGRFIELLGFKALGDDGSGSLEQIAQAIVDATHADADIISMSLGSTADSPPRVLVAAVTYALNQGAIVVAAAGNSDSDAITHFPSNIEGVIAVAAVNQALSKAHFSNTVGQLSRPIAAPGVDVLSVYLEDSYETMSGTSMATPIVAGLLGIMRALDPSIDAKDAYEILHRTGAEIQDTPLTGRVINAEAALLATD